MRTKAMTMIRRGALALVMCAVALTFSQTGQTQSACTVERGQDPLDVLNSGVRHNVWFILDTSGSMGGTLQGSGQSKFNVARQTIDDLLVEFVDAAGKPLVNWGFAWYWISQNSGGNSNGTGHPQCTDPFNGLGVYPDTGVANQCRGLDPNWFDPPLCGGTDPRPTITQQLQQLSPGPWTPNGIVTLQMARSIGQNNYATLLPNQKNYIILLTDGEDTCECDDILWPNTIPPGTVQLRQSDTTSALSGSFTSQGDIKAVNAGYKAAAAFIAMNGGTFPATEADVKGDLFVVGLGLGNAGRRRTNHLAWEGSGLRRAALFADDQAGLKQQLRNALSQIGVPASEVVGTPTVVGTVKERISSHTGPTLSSGDILADTATPDFDDIRVARLARDNHERNVAFSTSFEAPGFRGHLRATNIYTVNDPNNPKIDRTFTLNNPSHQLWDAGTLLQSRDPDARTIFFNRPGSNTRVEFTVGNVTATDLGVSAGFLDQLDGIGALTAAHAAEIVVRVTRGERISVDTGTGTIYNASGQLNFSKTDEFGANIWKLYDITGAPVVVQEPPRSVDFDPPLNHSVEYGVGGLGTTTPGFYWDNLNRQTMVYVGTNQGLFHAFRADSGAEMFAWIPDDMLGLPSSHVAGSRSTLKDIVELQMTNNNGVVNHLFGLSGAMNVDDVFLQTTGEWHTVVAFGRGKGGRYVTAIDVTDVGGPWDGSNDPMALDVTDPLGNELPQLLFNIGNPEEIFDPSDLMDGLGETWGMPAMFNVPSANSSYQDEWVMAVPGGYGCDNGQNEGQYLFIFRMEDGTLINRYQIDDNSAAPIRNGLITLPVGLTPHQADINDGKDWYTRIYVGDLHGQIWKLDVSNPGVWVWTKIYQTNLSFDQPIAADITLLYDPLTDHTWLFYGTGGDRRVDTTGRLFQVIAIRDEAPDGGTNLATLVWFRELGPEERIDSRPVIFGQFADSVAPPQVAFLSNRIEFFPAECRERFFGTLYVIDGLAGGLGAVDMDPNTGGQQDSVSLGEGKATGLFGSDNMLMVSSGNGLGQTGTTLVYTDGSGGQGGGPQDYSGRSGGSGSTGSVQVLVDSFRISPF